MNQLEDELSFHMLDTKAVGAIKFTRNHKTANEQRHEVEDSKDVHGNRIRAFGIEERAKSRSCTQINAYSDLKIADAIHDVAAIDVGDDSVASDLEQHVALALEESEYDRQIFEKPRDIKSGNNFQSKRSGCQQHEAQKDGVLRTKLIFDGGVVGRKDELHNGEY